MVYVRLTDAEIDANSPWTDDVTFKFRDNQDDFDTRLNAIETTGGNANSRNNNSILRSEVDASGRPNFISAGAGLTLNIDGSSVDLEMLIAGKFQEITTLSTLSLTDDQINFIFAEKGVGDTPTLGFIDLASSTVAPLIDYVAPGGSAADDHWFDLTENQMKRFTGTAFENKDRIFIGMAITSGGSIVDVVSYPYRLGPLEVYRRFGNGSDATENIASGTTTRDGLRQNTLVQVTSGAILNKTTQGTQQLRLYCQGPVLIRGTVDLKGRGAIKMVATQSKAIVNDGGLGGSGGGGGGTGAANGGDRLTEVGRREAGGLGGDPDANTAGADSDYEANENDYGMFLDGAGGAGATGADGGNGGGGVIIAAPVIIVTGTIDLRGDGGQGGQALHGSGGGGGGCLVTASRSFNKTGATISLTGGPKGGGLGGQDGSDGGDGTESELRI